MSQPLVRNRKQLFISTAILLSSTMLFAQSPRSEVHGPVRFDISPPLRDLAKDALKPSGPPHLQPEPGPTPWFGGGPTGTPDPLVVGRSGKAMTSQLAATVGANFDGISDGANGFNVTSAPPDTTGDIGPNHYVQWVNSSYAIFSRTGTVLVAPTVGNSLWSGFGGICQTSNDGDPLVKYDRLADRWVLTQFAVPAGANSQCIAISQTADPTGSYYRYEFSQPNFNDYPHMGVWPDAYYITYNMFSGNTFVGTRACAYDRTMMLAGQTGAGLEQCVQLANTYGSLLPSDWNGATAPPTGAPNYHYNFSTLSALNYWKFHVDWVTPANTTFGTGTNAPDGTVGVTAFVRACNGGTCVPQPGTTQKLDSLAGRLMYRVGYRKFPTYEAWVISHSVDTQGTGTGITGIRWYELRNAGATGAAPAKFQEGTFSPDSSYRWMPSIAMDKAGNIGVGYSVSSSAAGDFPSIRATGRVPDDAAGAMQSELLLQAGGGSQTTTLNRWGDYSTMQIDPTDDCTFWFTTEYLKANGTFNWSTRISSFKVTPSAPTGVTIDDTTVVGQITVSWTAVSNATSYTVTRYAGGVCGAGTPTTFTVAGGTNSYTDTSVVGGQTYSYNVTVTTACATSAASSCVSGTVSCTPPSVPGSVNAQPTAPNEITINWAASTPIAPTTGYRIYRSSSACPTAGSPYATVGVGVTTYKDIAATAPAKYFYTLTAISGSCGSAMSSCVNAIAYGDCKLAPTFAGLGTATASAASTCGVDLSWAAATSNCGGTISYNVYRSTTNGFTPDASSWIASGISSTTYTDTNSLTGPGQYFYIVRAVDSKNNEDSNLIQKPTIAPGVSPSAGCNSAPYDVQSFTVTSTGDAATGTNTIEWWNPSTASAGSTVTIVYRTDRKPTAPTDTAGCPVGEQCGVALSNRAVTAGSVDFFVHTGLVLGKNYNYGIWVKY
ncbi:MAG TPA: hypothetical protein VHL58_04315 [Thermoanaerobaculia bacterium]|nr:hypothetical protein [Thermoanaerobaculia bacterium]